MALAPPTSLTTCLLCHDCDLLVDLADLGAGQRAQCPRCGYLLSSCHKQATTRILVFALSALICLILSTRFEFVELSAVGLQRDLSLPQTVTALFALQQWSLGLFMAVVIVGLPLVFLVALSALAGSLALGYAGPWSFILLRCISFLRFWNMAEIFFLGILVSMVKIAGMAQIGLGLSFWSYACFNIFLILALAHVDRYQLSLHIRRLLEGSPEAQP